VRGVEIDRVIIIKDLSLIQISWFDDYEDPDRFYDLRPKNISITIKSENVVSLEDFNAASSFLISKSDLPPIN
jgi:hypothetical protein